MISNEIFFFQEQLDFFHASGLWEKSTAMLKDVTCGQQNSDEPQHECLTGL